MIEKLWLGRQDSLMEKDRSDSLSLIEERQEFKV